MPHCQRTRRSLPTSAVPHLPFTAFVALLAALLGASLSPAQVPTAPSPLLWEKLPALPDPVGFAGPYAGVSRGALVVAGGANFPGKKPWEGGAKVWHDDIFLLTPSANTWRGAGHLPGPRAYGVSITTPRGIACLGGSDSERHYDDCFLLRLTGTSDVAIEIEPLPKLPRACANMCGALIGNVLYLAGGSETPDAAAALATFWSLDLDDLAGGWRELEPWPGAGRILAVAAAQGGDFYLVGGAGLKPSRDGQPEREWLRDAFAYSPGAGWRPIAELPRPVVAAPSPAPNLGPTHFVLLGGDDGSRVSAVPKEHPGFPRTSLAYHTVTDTWRHLGEVPFSLVTTPAVTWQDSIVIPGGETRPGVRSNEVWCARTTRQRAPFGWRNYATLLAYPVAMLAISWYCARRTKNTNDYFRAAERIPWWAAGISIYATMLSSLTFMAVPATAYSTNWAYFLNYLSILLLAPIITRFYLPFFRRLDVTTAYEYLERRFNLFVRLFGAASFIAFQIARTGIVLYLPALALSTVSDLDMTSCIVAMTLLSIALTIFGGMEAVIWTDVAQTVILLGAVIASLAVIALRVDGGLEGIIAVGHEHGKFFENVRLTPSLTIATAWVALVGMSFNNLVSYTSNQEVVQRYLTTRDVRQASRAVWTNAILSLPSGLLFFTVGTRLYVFYQQFPQRLDPTLPTDAIFPLFILQELPAGVAGFVVAGIFAAAQPTSGLNSTAATVVTDFYRRFRPNVSDRRALLAGRIATLATGILGMGIALLAATLDIQSIWQLFLNLLGLTTGALAGLFALGIFTRRANGPGATLGLMGGVASIAVAGLATPIHPLLYGAVGVMSTFALGYLFSLPFKTPPLEGLTIHTLR